MGCHENRGPISIRLQPVPDGVPEIIRFFGCDSETDVDYAVVRALCKTNQRPTIETGHHVVWIANGHPSVIGTPNYLFILEVMAFELFAFPVDGEVISCINDRHRGRAVICLIHESTGSSVALYRYVYRNDRWFESESDRLAAFISDRALLTSSSFVLEHCISATSPSLIVGTTTGVKLLEIGTYQSMYKLSSLQAVKLLKPKLCGGELYILTSDRLQLYDVAELPLDPPWQPMNWSVAQLSLDGRHVAFAGTNIDKSCWIQVWNTMNQDVILNVTNEECDIASIAVSEMYVCYHQLQINTTGNSWKLVCLVLKSNANGKELVLWENKPSDKDWSLVLDGSVLVEGEWGASPYTVNLYSVPQKTALHTYGSRYPILAYQPTASGAHDNGCLDIQSITPSTTVPAPTTGLTTNVSSTVKPNSGTMRHHPDVPLWAWVIGSSCVIVFIVFCGTPLAGIVIILVCYWREKRSGRKYTTGEEHPNTLNQAVSDSRKPLTATNHVETEFFDT